MTKNKSYVMFAAAFFMWFSVYAYLPNFTPYMETGPRGFSPAMIGIIIGSYGLSQMILRIPVGLLSDKLGTRKLFITLGMVFTVISGLLLFLSDHFMVILIARVCAGAAVSTWVSFMVLFSSYYDKDKTVKAAGTLNFFNNMGQLGGIIFGTLLTRYSSLEDRAAFLLAAAAGVTAFILSFAIYEDRQKINIKTAQKGEADKPARFADVISNRNLIIISIIGTVSQLVTFSTIFGFTPAYARAEFNIGPLENGALMFFSYIPTAFGALFLGRYLSGRFKEYKLVVTGMLLMGATTVLIPFTTDYYTLIITQVIAGFGRGISFPLLMGLSIKNFRENQRGAAMGVFQAVYSFGMFFGPFITGLINENFELGAAFIFIGSICLVCTAASYFVLRKLDFSDCTPPGHN